MAFQLTLTPRFEKNFKALTAQEKKQVQNKLRLLAENPLHPSCASNASRAVQGFSSAASTWISASSGGWKATSSSFCWT